MKSTGIVRRVDELGRIVLPIELHRTLEISEKDPLEIFVDGESIILKPYQPGCGFCGKTDRHPMMQFGGQLICEDCKTKLKEALK